MKTAFGSQAKKPDCQRERSEQSERVQEKGPPFFCCYLPLNQCPERSSWALLPAHSDRRAARREISHQLLRKPQELGEKTGPGESSAANEVNTNQKRVGVPLSQFVGFCVYGKQHYQRTFSLLWRGHLSKQTAPRLVLEWESGVPLPLDLALQLHPGIHTGTYWERFPTSFLQKNWIPIFLSPWQSWAGGTTF